jgi:hypothetical protein
MDQPEIVKLLEKLTEVEDLLAVTRLEYDELKDKALTPKVRAELEAIEAEMRPRIDNGESLVRTLKLDIKEMVIRAGATVKGGRMQAVYMNGRKSIDTKGLEGYAVAHPEVRAFITDNKPSVSFRWMKEEAK